MAGVTSRPPRSTRTRANASPRPKPSSRTTRKRKAGGPPGIVKTPLTRSYRVFLRQGIWLYLLVLPWGIIGQMDWWAVPATVVQAYLFIAVDEIARAIENPFGHDEDDLDLDEICRTIERSVSDLANA